MRRLFTYGLVVLFGFAVNAQDFSDAPRERAKQDSPDEATLDLGQTIAAGGATRGGVGMKCMACHGRMGEGGGVAPRLAGLPWSYLADQLVAYRKGTRESAVMTQVASGLTAEEIHAVTAWYATREPTASEPQQDASTRVLETGGALAQSGLRATGETITACTMCHGETAQAGAAVPPLAGQSAGYIAKQLNAWQEGTRRNDPLNVMAEIAEQLTSEEIEAVAAYYASLPPAPQDE